MSDNFNKNRIAKNSILLYIRMLFTMWLNLYATRLVIKNLGVEDMGVYGVVGSIVCLFAVFSSGITNTIQRFITYELGKDCGDVNKMFCSSLNIIILLSVFILILLETVGIWFLYHKVNIPESCFNAAFWVFQLSVLTCVINLISIPYNALVIAHEKMDAYAVISIIQVVLTCVVAYCLSFFENDRLLIYAVLMAAISILIRFFYQAYCHIKFRESHYHLLIDRDVMKEIGKFAGVSTVSGILETLYGQGIVLVVNWTFGVALNAVYTIAMQLKNSVQSFAFNIFKAISPQITKTYANGEIESYRKLVYSGSKLQVYMILFIMIPFMYRTEYIMHLWLGEVPLYMVSFAQATIFLSLTYAIFEPIRTAVLATNYITKFMIIPNLFSIISLPISYIVARWTNRPEVLIVCVVGLEIVSCVIRGYYALKVSPLLLRDIVKEILFPFVKVALLSSLVCGFFTFFLKENLMGFLLLLLINSCISFFVIYYVGLNRYECNMVNDFIRGLNNNKNK